jgi:hypothetical protein
VHWLVDDFAHTYLSSRFIFFVLRLLLPLGAGAASSDVGLCAGACELPSFFLVAANRLHA